MTNQSTSTLIYFGMWKGKIVACIFNIPNRRMCSRTYASHHVASAALGKRKKTKRASGQRRSFVFSVSLPAARSSGHVARPQLHPARLKHPPGALPRSTAMRDTPTCCCTTNASAIPELAGRAGKARQEGAEKGRGEGALVLSIRRGRAAPKRSAFKPSLVVILPQHLHKLVSQYTKIEFCFSSSSCYVPHSPCLHLRLFGASTGTDLLSVNGQGA